MFGRKIIEDGDLGKIYDSRLLARLSRYLKPYWLWVAASVALLVVQSMLGVIGPYLNKVVIDRYLAPQTGAVSLIDPWLPAQTLDGINLIALVWISLLLVGFGLRYLQTYLMYYTGQMVMFDLRQEIFGHLQKLPVRFYDRHAVGRLVTRLTTDVDVLNEMFTSGVVAIFGDLLTLAAITIAMLYLSPPLTLALFAVSPLVVLVTLLFRKRARSSFRAVRVAIAKINAFLQEHLSGIAVVQLFNHEYASWKEFDAINAEHRDSQHQAIRAHAWFFPSIEWLGVLGVVVVLIYGGFEVLNGAVTIGIVVAFLQYGTRMFRPIRELSDKYNVLQAAMASSERIFKLLDTPADESATSPAVEAAHPERLPKDLPVEFRNVWFAYNEGEWVLRNVSFTVEPGETLAVVGHTGAGKTTLINLLLRFYNVDKGQILVGGRDVRAWPVLELRRKFGIVLQDPYLFKGTIESNIRLGTESISRERVEQAAGEVNLSSFIDALPNRFDEPIFERGNSLSSGQKQLVSFARALAHHPDFLILDEATSSVDTETEIRIREAQSKLVERQTSIVIAHRLSTIQRATRILVMHKGEVREIGPHRELLAAGGIYARLHRLQYLEEGIARGRAGDVRSLESEAVGANGKSAGRADAELDGNSLDAADPGADGHARGRSASQAGPDGGDSVTMSGGQFDERLDGEAGPKSRRRRKRGKKPGATEDQWLF